MITVLCKLPIRMGEFAPPETDRPSGLLGCGRIRSNESYMFRLFRIQYVDCSTHKCSSDFMVSVDRCDPRFANDNFIMGLLSTRLVFRSASYRALLSDRHASTRNEVEHSEQEVDRHPHPRKPEGKHGCRWVGHGSEHVPQPFPA